MVIWGGVQAPGMGRWALPAAVAVLCSSVFKLGTEWLADHGGPAWLIGGELVAGMALLTGLLLARSRVRGATT